MRDLLKSLETPALWALFFFTSVYGHVALKAAVNRVPGGGYRQVLTATVTNIWGWSAYDFAVLSPAVASAPFAGLVPLRRASACAR